MSPHVNFCGKIRKKMSNFQFKKVLFGALIWHMPLGKAQTLVCLSVLVRAFIQPFRVDHK